MKNVLSRVFRLMLRWFFTYVMRVELRGWQQYPSEARRLIIIANHVSRLDSLLLWALLPDDRLMLVRPWAARHWWSRPVLAMVPHLVVDIEHPYFFHELVQRLDEGNRLIGFPEGRMSVTGTLMKVQEAAALAIDKADALVAPIHIGGAQYSVFGVLGGSYRWRLLPRVRLTMLKPRRLQPSESADKHGRRRRVGRMLDDLMREIVYLGALTDRPVLEALLEAKSRHGARRVIVEDIRREPLNYRQLLIRSFVLGELLEETSAGERYVGLLLPTSAAFLAAMIALHARGRVPVVLNYTLGARRLVEGCEDTGLKTVYASRAFVEAAKLQDAVTQLERLCRVVFLEDLQSQLSLGVKLRGFSQGMFPLRAFRRVAGSVCGDDPAVVLFTSGSEGKPKGVVLTHRNLLANCAQVDAVLDLRPTDVMINALPLFHSFGLTAGTLVGLLTGFKIFLYPSPLHYRVIPQLAYEQCATLLAGTNTFLRNYARSADPYDFFNIRMVVGGAEPVQEQTERLWSEKIGVRVFEGYGVTEASPILACNSRQHYRFGTVGRLVPGLKYYLAPVEGLAGGGRLCVRGANIMAGYWQPERPGEWNPPRTERGTGWYDTGDIVSIDEEGFVTILGRARRFAKIAGEMISLAEVERLAAQLWPDHQHAAVSLPDPSQGEQIVLLTTNGTAMRRDLASMAREVGLNTLLVPKSLISLDELPLLGSGKVDYGGVRRLAEQRLGAADEISES